MTSLLQSPAHHDQLTQRCLTAQDRGLLDQADDWYRQALAIEEELGDCPGMTITYHQLGLLAEERAQPSLALEWNIRSVTLFDQFPGPQAGMAPATLARLADQFGMTALEIAWQQTTSQPVPRPVRDYLTSHHDQKPPGETT